MKGKIVSTLSERRIYLENQYFSKYTNSNRIVKELFLNRDFFFLFRFSIV